MKKLLYQISTISYQKAGQILYNRKHWLDAVVWNLKQNFEKHKPWD